MPGDDLHQHAVNASNDFYELLEVEPSARDNEIRRAYRKTALKYHPDKVGESGREKFDLLQIAYDVLSDEHARQLYDNARRAREEKKARQAAYDGRKREMVEKLERAEMLGKRKRDGLEDEEEKFEQEMRRIQADGARRRRQREEQLRREAQEIYEREQREQHGAAVTKQPEIRSEIIKEQDRMVKLRYPVEAAITRDELISRFAHFGKISEAVLRTKKIKVDGQKHRKEYTTAVLEFSSIVGAHDAVTDFPDLKESDTIGTWAPFENVDWLGGQEPSCIPKLGERSIPTEAKLSAEELNQKSELTQIRLKNSERRRRREREAAEKVAEDSGSTPEDEEVAYPTPKSIPTFASFKQATGSNSPAPADEERLREERRDAERRRLCEELKREEETEEAAAVA